MKISELFESFDEYEVISLFEHLGNLDVVDKKFVPIMKTFPKYEYISSRQGTRMTMMKNTMPQKLGRRSEVQSIDVKSGAEAYRQLVESETARAIIVNTNNEQVFAAFKVPSEKANGAPDYIWVADLAHLLSHVTEHEQHVEAQSLLDKADVIDYGDNRFKLGNDKELYRALTSLLKVTKMGGNKAVQMYVIFADIEREKEKEARLANRKFDRSKTSYTVAPPQTGKKQNDPHQLSAVFLQAAQEAGLKDAEELAKLFRKSGKTRDETDRIKSALYDIKEYYAKSKKKFPLENLQSTDWNYMAKSALASRLADFKTEFAKNVSTPEEFMKLLQEKGFLEKFKIHGILYKQSSDSINFSSLKAGKPDNSYIEYSVETWGENKAYDELKDTLKELVPTISDDEVEQQRLYKKYAPPYNIKVFLKLDKNAIVVDRIESEKWFKKLKR